MRARMHRITVILCFLVALRITGLDLALAQVGVWGQMVYLRSEQGLKYALSSTFSGNAPCSQCHALQRVRKDASNSPLDNLSLFEKLKLPLCLGEERGIFCFRVKGGCFYLSPLSLSSLCFLGVEKPPPDNFV